MNSQEELKALKERIAELERLAKEEQEFPQDGDEYWYIDTTGDILHEIWGDFRFEKDMLEIGNVFRTEQEAEFAVEKLKVEEELKKFSRPFENGEINHYIFLDTNSDCLDVAGLSYSQYQGTIYFESEEKVQQAIDTIGAERIKKYIFGVEE